MRLAQRSTHPAGRRDATRDPTGATGIRETGKLGNWERGNGDQRARRRGCGPRRGEPIRPVAAPARDAPSAADPARRGGCHIAPARSSCWGGGPAAAAPRTQAKAARPSGREVHRSSRRHADPGGRRQGQGVGVLLRRATRSPPPRQRTTGAGTNPHGKRAPPSRPGSRGPGPGRWPATGPARAAGSASGRCQARRCHAGRMSGTWREAGRRPPEVDRAGAEIRGGDARPRPARRGRCDSVGASTAGQPGRQQASLLLLDCLLHCREPVAPQASCRGGARMGELSSTRSEAGANGG